MSEILRSINPAMADLLLPPVRAAARPLARRREPAPYVDEEEEQSLAGSLRDKSLTMIGAAGNLLDLPGSMARDVISSVAQGKFVNPFDQLLDPFGSENRTTGRDLLRQSGMAGNEDTWGNAIAGFGAEVALDPLTYMTLGGSALGKAGKAASKAGMFDELASVAARKHGKQLGQVGNREARLTTTLGDMAKYGSEKASAKASELIKANPELADEAFGGMVGFGLPFMEPMAIAGQGAKSQAVARGLDTAGRAVRYAQIPGTEIKPVNSLLNLFDAPGMGTKTPFGHALATEHTRAKDVNRTEIALDANRTAGELEKAGMLDNASADLMRQGLESVIPINQLPVTLQPIVKRMRAETAEMPGKARKEGTQLTELTDDEIDYAARFLIQSRGHHGKRTKTVFNADDPSQQARLDFIRNVPGGTNALKELLQDPAINKAIDDGFDPETVRLAVEAKAKGWLPDSWKEYKPKHDKADKDGWVEREKGRYKEIADWMSKNLSKETRDAGVFGNHPILDHQARRMAFEDSLTASHTVAKGLSQKDILLPLSTAANAGADGSMTVGEVLSSLKLNLGDANGGMGRKILELRGVPVDDTALEVLSQMRLSKTHAEELQSIHKVISGPEAVNDLIQMVDSVTNYSKGMWTSVWPAFHVRNRLSGAFQNMALGIWSKAGDSQANTVLKGDVIEGAAQKPWVIAEYQRRLAKDAAASGQTPPGQAPVPGQTPPGTPPGPGAGGATSGSNPMMRDDGPPAGGFYSKLSQATQQKVSGKVDWNQYQKTMKGAGVKDEEIADLELEQFFKTGPKTKKEIQEYVEQNTPDIEIVEKVSSSSPKYSPRSWPDNQAEFEGFKIPGGDEGSYREVLIKQKHPGTYEKEAKSFRREMRKKYGDGWTDNLSPEDAARHQEVLKGVERGSKLENRGAYSGPHWREQNVIAHARLDDITNPDGTRTLRIGEIQSDWHQTGRNTGYQTAGKAPTGEGWTAEFTGSGWSYNVYDDSGEFVDEVSAASTSQAIEAAIKGRKVPDGPFKKSWSKLAFRQVLKMAIDEGYDEIGIVRGRDAAKAVGGPVDELSEAYSIMLKDAKDYTKKYGSYVGETQVASTNTAVFKSVFGDRVFEGTSPTTGLTATVSRDGKEWWVDAKGESVGGFKNRREAEKYARSVIEGSGETGYRWSSVTTASEDSQRFSRLLDAEGEQVGRIEFNADGTFTARSGEQVIGAAYETQEAARRAVLASVGDSSKYDGGLHVFKITDEMRREITGKGQPLYTMKDGGGEAAAAKAGGVTTAANPADVWHPATFAARSKQHERFNSTLERLSTEGVLDSQDADILRLAFSGASEDGMSIMNMPHIKGVDSIKDGKAAGQWRWQVSDKTGLMEFDIDIAKNLPATQSSVGVLLHELGHMAQQVLKNRTDIYGGEMAQLINRVQKSGRLDQNLKALHGDKLGEYLAKTYDEQFPQLFADSIMRRKVPEGAVGKIMKDIRNWVVQFLEKLKLAKPLPAPTQKRIDEIIDELLGFDGTKAKATAGPSRGTRGTSGSANVIAGTPPGQTAPPAPPTGVPGQPSNVPPVLDDEYATRIIGEMLAANGVVGKFEGNAVAVSGIANKGQSGDIEDLLSGIGRPGTKTFSAGRALRKAVGMEPGTSLNPLDVRGVGGRTESGLGIAAAGEELGHATEFMNRAGPWITMMDRGYDAAEAAKKTGAAQVLYSNKNFTDFETKVMGRLFPFYKFSRGSMPVIIRHLMEKPGGPYATVIKGTNRAQSDGNLAPDYVRDTANIPIDPNNPIMSMIAGTPPKGTDRYLTGFGLMHEDALSFGPSVRGAGLEALSRMNPFLKGPLEWATGQTFFQRGPEGGRDLDKLDPTVGRLVANVMGQTEQDDSKKFPLWMEQIVANSPIARLTTTARSLTDPRKRSETVPFMPGPAALFNTLSGVRVSDVSPGSKDAILREMLSSEMEDAGASVFERVYFSKEELAKMSPAARVNAIKLQGLANVLAKRAKERKAERDAAKAKK
jgi:hypothetical protein